MRTMTGTGHRTDSGSGRHNRPGVVPITVAVLSIAFFMAAPAAAQDRPRDPPHSVPAVAAEGPASTSTTHQGEAGPHHDGTQPTRPFRDTARGQALEREIRRLEREIAELARLLDWQERLRQAARTDPEGARRQRRSRESCLATPLAQWCHSLSGMY